MSEDQSEEISQWEQRRLSKFAANRARVTEPASQNAACAPCDPTHAVSACLKVPAGDAPAAAAVVGSDAWTDGSIDGGDATPLRTALRPRRLFDVPMPSTDEDNRGPDEDRSGSSDPTDDLAISHGLETHAAYERRLNGQSDGSAEVAQARGRAATQADRAVNDSQGGGEAARANVDRVIEAAEAGARRQAAVLHAVQEDRATEDHSVSIGHVFENVVSDSWI